MASYKAVCFDIDGTLYSRKYEYRSEFKAFLLHPVAAIRVARGRNKIRKNSLFAEDGTYRALEGVKTQGFYKVLAAGYRKIKAYDGVVRTVRYIKSKGLKVGFLSDFPLMGRLETLGLAELSDSSLSCDEVGCLKPCSRAFDALAESLGVEKKDILYVGDSYEKDYLGARENKMGAVLIGKRGYPTWHEFDKFIREMK